MARAVRHLLSSSYISQSSRILSPLFTHVRSLPVASIRWCHSNMLGDSVLSEEAYLNPGMDFKHWFVEMNIREIGETNSNFSIDERVDLYVKTLAKVVGSEEEAKKKIYKINCVEEYRSDGPGFGAGIGCEIDWETTNLLRGLPYVNSISPDSYADPENKDYGGLKKWIELLSRPIPSPWLLLPPPEFGDKEQYNNNYRFYSIAERKEFSINRNEEEEEEDEFVGSSHGWLALFRRSNCQLFLSNPLSRQRIKLPSTIQTLSQVGKVIISCSPNSEEEDCRAVMMFGPKNCLAFCCPSHSDARWTHIGGCNYSDIIYSRSHKRFLCLTNCGRLEGWDLSSPVSPRLVEKHEFNILENPPVEEVIPLNKTRIHQVKHIVLDEQSEELFIVMLQILKHESGWGYYVQSSDPIYPYTTDAIKVYKIDKERKGCFCSPDTLNGLAMFIGTNHSFALPASEYPELDDDCILYTDEMRLIPSNWAALPYGAPDFDVYSYAHDHFFSRDRSNAFGERVGAYKYSYVFDRRTMKRAPPLPMWFTPTLQ